MTLNELQKELGMEARQTGVFVSALASNGLLQVTKTEEGSEILGITIMTSNEIDARQMDEDDLEEADRIMKLAFGTFIGLPTPVINVKSNRKREKIVRPQSCIPFPVHTTASIDR